MEELDRELQKRVWSRVQNRGENQMPPLKQENLKVFFLPIQENIAAYQQLARQNTGKSGEKLRRLHQESQQYIACIKGICRLQGEQVKLKPLMPPKEQARRMLEKCYHREKRLWSAWEQRSLDPEHGVVFGRLAQQAREHCVTIMEILGQLGE